MKGWVAGWVARPIAEGERRLAFLIAAFILLIAAGGLRLANLQPGSPRAHRAATPTPAAVTPASPSTVGAVGIPAPAGGSLGGSGPAAAMASGRAFLSAYLRFAYGQAPPKFPDATAQLAGQLTRFHVTIPAALRARRLSLLALRANPDHGGWEVGALASDGVSSFPVAAILERQRGRWQAVRLVTAAGGS